jgi:hypothetical protein
LLAGIRADENNLCRLPNYIRCNQWPCMTEVELLLTRSLTVAGTAQVRLIRISESAPLLPVELQSMNNNASTNLQILAVLQLLDF